MPAFKKQLKPGALLKTKIGEVYLYLGRYRGTPYSYYETPDEDYLYVFVQHDFEETDIKTIDAKDEVNVRGMDRCMDGNACYTKNPKQFASFLGMAENFGPADAPAQIWRLTKIREDDNNEYAI